MLSPYTFLCPPPYLARVSVAFQVARVVTAAKVGSPAARVARVVSAAKVGSPAARAATTATAAW
jgi:hypothetical protein